MSVLPPTKIQDKKNTKQDMKHKFRYHGFQQKLRSRLDSSAILCVPSLKAQQLVEQKLLRFKVSNCECLFPYEIIEVIATSVIN